MMEWTRGEIELIQGIIIGLCIMSLISTIGFLLYDNNKESGIILLGPMMWLLLFGIFLVESIIKLFKGRKCTLYKFEQLKKLGSYYKHLFGNYHMFRYYNDKNKHPILYHLIIIEKIKIIENKKIS